jgi:hypothetical protein
MVWFVAWKGKKEQDASMQGHNFVARMHDGMGKKEGEGTDNRGMNRSIEKEKSFG